MADIIPFKGILYNQEKIKDISQVVTPPYDVISPDDQEKFYNRNEYNMIRLDLGKEYPDDSEQKNRYTRAAGHLSNWLSNEILIRDDAPSLYYYDLTYSLKDGTQKIMKGFIALCKLEDFSAGVVVPHEYTLSKPKSDRLNLLRACTANFSFIFSLYSSGSRRINDAFDKNIGESAPKIDVSDDNKYRHRLWSVSDPAVINLVQEEMKNQTVYIADGHHRYESSLNYRNEMREKGAITGDNNPANYILMYFANMDEPGLTVLPTHRLLHSLPAEKLLNLTDKLAVNFNLQYFNFDQSGEPAAKQRLLDTMKQAKPEEHLFGLYLHGDSRYILLSLKNEALLDKRSSDKPLEWRRLDVAILQNFILEDILGLSEDSIRKQENLTYVKDDSDAINRIRDGKCQIGFLLNATKIEEIKDVTNTGERMPQKSTYFYPKFLTGLVFYKF